MKNSIFYLLISIFAFSCSKPQETEKETEKPDTELSKELKSTESEPVTGATQHTGDNSQTSLDWPGTYFATLPCGHCEGIETWVTLNQDGTFVLKTHHMGLNDDREEIFTGKFTWDPTGSTIQLEGLIGGAPGKYKVGENQLWHLDQAGNRIEGDLADHYILKKQ
ncbi:copper resistance protein NlpE [Algoriphagus sp. A40]|uniref:copper resistance protein NlpE n=1 Tax=Algoriphagus sp. A40 TaxID=1945863 RepID=UPI000986E958|nr:copper resistance protein NlpE [Algoriphagus sp. A40]OOG70461.1 hypothetical protein B0E43_17795 [Algoriphagus sp. A40]